MHTARSKDTVELAAAAHGPLKRTEAEDGGGGGASYALAVASRRTLDQSL